MQNVKKQPRRNENVGVNEKKRQLRISECRELGEGGGTDTSATRDLRLRNGTRKNESEREKKPIKKMIHSETKFSFIFKD